MKTLLLLFFIISCTQLPVKRTDKLSVLQGVTNTKEVEFSVVATKGRSLRFELRNPEGAVVKPEEEKVIERDFSPYSVHKIVFQRDPGQEYNLYAYDGDKLVDQRLVGRGQLIPSRLKLAVASCMDDSFEKEFKIWNELAARNPEYLLMIGDNVYADKGKVNADPETLWRRYADVRLTLPIYFQEKLIPVHALWDDHDYGANDSNEKFPYKKESKEVFDAFYAQDLSDDDWSHAFGVGGLLSLGDYNLYFLDGRSFRSVSPEGQHLGMDQKAWLEGKLKEENTPSFLIMGDQFFGGYHKFESFEGNHPRDFEDFVKELHDVQSPFIFVSGDRHMSEIMQFPRGLFGKPSFEITSSPIHAKTHPEGQDHNPWRVVANREHENFTIIENEAKDNHWFMTVENIGQNGETFYKRELAVFIKDLQNNLNEIRKLRKGKRRYRRIRRHRR